nr:MAG TPA: hypothetical protein [Bacteriophage sp.]
MHSYGIEPPRLDKQRHGSEKQRKAVTSDGIARQSKA